MALRWSGAGQIALCLVSAFGGVMSVCAQASLRAADFTDAVPSTRTLHFPHDRSIGTVHIRDWGHVSDGTGEMFCQARGDVVIPAGKAAILELSVQGPQPLQAPLAALGPNHLQGVRFGGALVGNADLAHLGGLTGLRELQIVGGALGDDGLVHLSALTSLEYLRITGSNLTGDGFVHLRGLRSLHTLALGFNCTGEGLACLRDLPALRKLRISASQVTDTGAAEIAQLKSLVDLYLANTTITDAGLACLSALDNLSTLSLSCRQLSDGGLAPLGRIESLRHLALRNARITEQLANDLLTVPSLEKVSVDASSATSAGTVMLARLPAVEEIVLFGPHVDDAAIAGVAAMRSLKSLHIISTKVSDRGLAQLSNLSSLEVLRLGGGEITDAGLVHLAGLVGLRHLSLSGEQITGAGLAHLAGLRSLETLRLAGTQVTDDSLLWLQDMESLRHLELRRTKVTDAGLKYLARLQSLQELDLGGTQLTGDGLVYLRSLPQLRRLALPYTKVTDAALAHLKNIPSLERLDLIETNVGDAVLELCDQMPLLKRVLIHQYQLSAKAIERLQNQPNRKVLPTGGFPAGMVNRRYVLTSLRPSPTSDFPPDVDRILRALEWAMRGGWKGRIVQRGIVRPGQFQQGNGVYAILEADRTITTDSRTLSYRAIHFWIMEPAYQPLPVQTDSTSGSPTLYVGRTDQYQAFCYLEPARPSTVVSWPVPVFIRDCLVNAKELLDLSKQGLESSDPELRRSALSELFLYVIYSGKDDYAPVGSLVEQVIVALRRNLDADLLKHLTVNFGDYETIHFLARCESQPMWVSPHCFPDGPLRELPDFTEGVYREIIRRAKADPDWLVAPAILDVLCRMVPPPEDELQGALRLPPFQEGYPLAFHKIAINHATVGRYAGLAYDIAPYLWCDDGFTREAALEYFQQVRSPHAATGLFRSLAEGRRSRKGDSPLFGGIAFFGREAVLFPSRQPPWPSRRDLTLDWIESGWPWRGNLDVFCTLPFSDELRALICDFLRRQDPSNLPEQYSPQHMALLLALNFLIRNPSPEALPGLLRILGDNSSRQQSASLTSSLGDRRTLWHEIAFNTGNLPEIAAAQAIMQLGAQASRPVLEYVNNQVSRVSGATPQKWSPSLFVGLLILGALADEQTYDGFQALGSQLQGTPYHKCWQTADQWYVQGGRQFHPPRPPRQSVVARVSGRPGPRTLRFPTYGRAGALLMRDWGSTPTAAWQPIAEAVGNVTVPSGKELKLVPEHRPPPATLFHKILNRVGFKIQPTAPPPDLKKLSRLHTDDLQVLDLSGHDLDNRQLAALKRLTELHRLDLHATPIGDKGLAHLKNLKSLEWLDLSATQVSDGGLAHLTALRNLRILDLSGTKVTDAGVQHLKRMTSLRTLCLGETPITRKALRELQEALPLCEIWK